MLRKAKLNLNLKSLKPWLEDLFKAKSWPQCLLKTLNSKRTVKSSVVMMFPQQPPPQQQCKITKVCLRFIATVVESENKTQLQLPRITNQVRFWLVCWCHYFAIYRTVFYQTIGAKLDKYTHLVHLVHLVVPRLSLVINYPDETRRRRCPQGTQGAQPDTR